MVSTKNLTSTIPILTGMTGSGKTKISIEAALEHGNVEIINSDSLLIYREISIGTAKPTIAERAGIPHHLIDTHSIQEEFHAAHFRNQVLAHIQEIQSRGKVPLIVGGSGFYLKALVDGIWDAPGKSAQLRAQYEVLPTEELFRAYEKLDSEGALELGGHDRYRLIRALEIYELSGKKRSELRKESTRATSPGDIHFSIAIVDRPKEELEKRLSVRIDEMLQQGWIEEVKNLFPEFAHTRPLKSVGYRQILDYLNGHPPAGRKPVTNLTALRGEILLAHLQLAKKQRTFFKGQFPQAHTFSLDKDYKQLRKWLDEQMLASGTRPE